jgi:hypothetical protein
MDFLRDGFSWISSLDRFASMGFASTFLQRLAEKFRVRTLPQKRKATRLGGSF